MKTDFRLICQMEILTPMFLGGADQNKPEIRAASIKGALRFWYRAIDPDFAVREPLVFGSGGKEGGQSLLRLRATPGDRARDLMVWADAKAEQFNQGSGRQTANGLTYLGYPFGMGDNRSRQAVRPGAKFELLITMLRGAPEELGEDFAQRAALASVWMLGHFGSLGSRARRGFGALALTEWRCLDREGKVVENANLGKLPLLHASGDTRAWHEGAVEGIRVCRDWFGAFPDAQPRKVAPRHPHLGAESQMALSEKTHKREDWRGAMLSLGTAMQGFRQRRQPDYDQVKGHVLWNLRKGGQALERAPDRASFGLPITFRFGSEPQGRPVTVVPSNAERQGSLLMLRPVLFSGGLAGLFLRLSGEVPGTSPPAEVRESGRRLGAPRGNAMDDFMRELNAKGVA